MNATKPSNRQKAFEAMTDTLEGWSKAAAAGVSPGDELYPNCGDAIYSVDRAEIVDVMTAGGGPTTWFRFVHVGGDVTEATYNTTAHTDDHWTHVIELGADRGQDLFDLLGLGAA
jgi:hypothetical protein